MNLNPVYFRVIREIPKSKHAALADYKRLQRYYMRTDSRPLRKSAIPLRQTLSEAMTFSYGWKTVYNDDYGDSWKEYVVIKDAQLTDEDMREIVEDLWISNPASLYDCTGRTFTSYISWRRLPCGILIIHGKGIDV